MRRVLERPRGTAWTRWATSSPSAPCSPASAPTECASTPGFAPRTRSTTWRCRPTPARACRRMRYYQSAMDTAMLGAREPPTTVCPRALSFHLPDTTSSRRGLPVYTFDMICDESGSVVLGHGFKWVVLNASAWEMLPDGPLRGLLRYVATEEGRRRRPYRRSAVAVEAANEDAPWRGGVSLSC